MSGNFQSNLTHKTPKIPPITMKSKIRTSLNDLPREILQSIFLNLGFLDMYILFTITKNINKAIVDPSFIKEYLHKNGTLLKAVVRVATEIHQLDSIDVLLDHSLGGDTVSSILLVLLDESDILQYKITLENTGRIHAESAFLPLEARTVILKNNKRIHSVSKNFPTFFRTWKDNFVCPSMIIDLEHQEGARGTGWERKPLAPTYHTEVDGILMPEYIIQFLEGLKNRKANHEDGKKLVPELKFNNPYA